MSKNGDHPKPKFYCRVCGMAFDSTTELLAHANICKTIPD